MNRDAAFDISVVIPTYNRVAFLPEAIESVLRQTVPVREIIVVDDGSTDGTREAVAALCGPIRYIYQTNQGPGAARNLGMRMAAGEWIAFQDSDDRWVPESIAVQTTFLRQHPTVDFVFAHLCNFEGDQRDAATPEILDQGLYAYLKESSAPLEGFFHRLLRTNPIPTATVMFRRACLESVGWFDETLGACEDYDLWLRFAERCRCGFIDRVLLERRIHDGNLIHDYANIYERLLSVYERLPERLGGKEAPAALRKEILAAQSRTHCRLGEWYFSKHRWAEAEQHLRAAKLRRLELGFRKRAFFVFKRLLVSKLRALGKIASNLGTAPAASGLTS